MHLLRKLDPSNEEYKKRYKEVRVLARQAKGMDLYLQAENAENYQKCTCFRFISKGCGI